MSEVEFLRRQRYKRNRKRLSLIQLVAIMILAAMALASFLVYYRIDKTQLIKYTESGNVDYRVQYRENEFFPDEWIEKDQTYISSLIKQMSAEFTYNLNTSSSEMRYNYQYVINAKLLIGSKDKGTPYYTYEEQVSPQKSGVIKNKENLEIKEAVTVDYVKYNTLAKSFINTYGLDTSASCTLIVTMDVVTLCENNGFENTNQVNYSTSMNIPLAVDSVNIFRTSASVEGQTNNLEYAGATNRNTILSFAHTFTVLALILLVLRTLFLIWTRNEDVTYKARVNKIVKSYGSFIQKMFGEFDCDGYQIIQIKSFVEMLGIRDTILSPVLMSENKDETMTRFYIPTATKLLYVFEIKIDNYDEIYGIDPDDGPDGDGPDDGGFNPPNDCEPALKNESEPKPHHENEKTLEVVNNDVVEEIVIFDASSVEEAEIESIANEPTPELEKIDYVDDTPNEEVPFVETEEKAGVEVVGVVWPEKPKRNKIYKYDPDGEQTAVGDVVIVPTFDASNNREVVRKAAVAHANHRVPKDELKHPLKKIVGVIRKKLYQDDDTKK